MRSAEETLELLLQGMDKRRQYLRRKLRRIDKHGTKPRRGGGNELIGSNTPGAPACYPSTRQSFVCLRTYATAANTPTIYITRRMTRTMTKPMIPERIEEKKQIAVTVSRMPEEKINDLYDKICELAHAEDGEQLEDILSEFNLMNVGYDAAWDEVERLLAALEESQQSAKNWEESYLSLHENSGRSAQSLQRHSRP